MQISVLIGRNYNVEARGRMRVVYTPRIYRGSLTRFTNGKTEDHGFKNAGIPENKQVRYAFFLKPVLTLETVFLERKNANGQVKALFCKWNT